MTASESSPKRVRVRLTPEMKSYLAAESKRTGMSEDQLLQLVIARSKPKPAEPQR